ncbi:RNA polymerase sigma factor [Desulfotruncus arcticus]|nr:sigma factor [Desulfotruncus arcticus]
MAIKNEDDRYKAVEIYKLYRGTMLYIANSILHETHLAEDAVSEAFIRIIDNLEKINTINDHQTRGFVVIIVRNISLDLLRRQNRNQTKPLDDYIEYSEYKEPVLDDIAARGACDKIADSIAKLNKNYSDILYLKMELKHRRNWTDELKSLFIKGAESQKYGIWQGDLVRSLPVSP